MILNEKQKMLKADIEETKDRVLRKFPRLGVAMSQLKIEVNKRVQTAETDGEKIYFSPRFYLSLSDKEKDFLFAHEVMHVAFNHILRSKEKNHKLWNIATDSVINQMLINEKLPMIKGGVDIKEALNNSAEEMYEKLLKEKEERDKQKQQSQNQSGNSNNNQKNEDDSGNEQAGHDSHEIWKEAIKKAEKKEEKQRQREKGQKIKANEEKNQESDQSDMEENDDNTKTDKNTDSKEKIFEGKNGENKQNASKEKENSDGQDENRTDYSSIEKSFLEENKAERAEMAKKIIEKLKSTKNKSMAEIGSTDRAFGDVGKGEAVVDWKKVLKKFVEEEKDRWSYRRSSSENDYMARVEMLEEEDKSETEVLLDVSGSVGSEFLKEFLRQLKPILKESKLMVGCFDTKFYGFKEIKKERDINEYRFPGGGGTSFDIAVSSFSKDKKKLNKIIFTDGYDNLSERFGNDPKNKNIIWLVYGNKDFNPCCGKVVQVDQEKINEARFMRSKDDGMDM